MHQRYYADSHTIIYAVRMAQIFAAWQFSPCLLFRSYFSIIVTRAREVGSISVYSTS